MSFVLIQICTIIIIALEILVPIGAVKKSSNIDGFMLENKRTRTRQNYILERDSINDGDMDEGITYLTEPRELDATPEELPALIIDYANMIRNDIILLDNSVQRTGKRGNAKLRKQKGLKIDVPCICEHDNRETVVLGADYVPQVIETLICNKSICPKDYRCLQRFHDITVLKRREHEDIQPELPRDLGRHWITVKKSVTVGCYCSKNYTDHN